MIERARLLSSRLLPAIVMQYVQQWLRTIGRIKKISNALTILATKPFVNLFLSPVNKSLHAAARIRAKELNYKYTWINNGRIFMRKDDFGEAILIDS